jgi:UTP--glucose-1-phosphate uridylyltransferase
MPPVTRAVILAAGLGTRLLPATKAVPKEMIPIVDRPLIQYAVEEAAASGITDVVFVIAEGKEAVREHFAAGGRVETLVRAKGDREQLAAVTAPAALARFHYAFQDKPLGIAHAVACAREYVEGAPFVLMFPDDLILGQAPVVRQLIDAHAQCGGSVIAVQDVPRAEIPQYGIVDPDGSGNPVRLKGIVEKPSPEAAPSSLGVVGRYLLSASIFDHVDRILPGKGGELQITDALASQIAAGEGVFAFQYEGTRYDTGRPLGLLIAAVGAALAREDLAGPTRGALARMLSGGA